MDDQMKSYQLLLLQWFNRHGVKKPNEMIFRQALNVMMDAKDLNEAIPWMEMKKEFVPKKLPRLVGYSKASELIRHNKAKKKEESVTTET